MPSVNVFLFVQLWVFQRLYFFRRDHIMTGLWSNVEAVRSLFILLISHSRKTRLLRSPGTTSAQKYSVYSLQLDSLFWLRTTFLHGSVHISSRVLLLRYNFIEHMIGKTSLSGFCLSVIIVQWRLDLHLPVVF